MDYKKAKWLIYSVIVGLIPFIARCFVSVITKGQGIDFAINETDFVTFGLILHITNINELEHMKLDDDKSKSWKTIQNGISIVFIAIYSVIFTVSCISTTNSTLFDKWIMKLCSIILSVSSFIISYSIYNRLSGKKS